MWSTKPQHASRSWTTQTLTMGEYPLSSAPREAPREPSLVWRLVITEANLEAQHKRCHNISTSDQTYVAIYAVDHILRRQEGNLRIDLDEEGCELLDESLPLFFCEAIHGLCSEGCQNLRMMVENDAG